ncbi:MAG: NAD(P)-binding domain-containing protein [Bacteroidales bacterium]|nr:NAD(P)-binding domain-containing protein [Bacteroidales bacterium]
MAKFGLFGSPISHSKSPALFSAGYGDSLHTYSLFETATADEAIELFRSSDILGANVTSPFKDKVMEHVTLPDRISSLLGSANVLIKDYSGADGKLQVRSYNTDYYGVKNTIGEFLSKSELLPDALHSDGIKKVAVVGAGGAGKAATLAMCDAGHQVSLINRSAGRVAEFAAAVGAVYVPLADVAECLADADIVIYSLSFLVPQLEGFDFSKKIVFEANYANAALSPEKGVKSGLYIDGRYWLYHQAIPAFELFTGCLPNTLEMRKVMGIE